MHALLTTLVAAEEVDPATVRPVPLSALVFLLLLVMVVVLLRSFVRHLRRAQSNLGSAQQAASDPGQGGPPVPPAAGDAADPGVDGAQGRPSARSAGPGQVPGEPV